MYHGRFKKNHYEAGFNWGRLLYNNGKIISNNHTFRITEERKKFNNYEVDDWRAKERYLVAYNTLKEYKNNYSFDLIKDILSGKYGFMCQYDRKTDADTVWSVIYDIGNGEIYRVEGNPRRKQLKKDTRLKFKN